MPAISLQHIIGTVALIGLVISTGLFYTMFTGSVQIDSRQQELKQISQNVALNIEEMINLVKFETRSSDNSNYTVKILDLPTSIGGQTYKIQLIDGNPMMVHSFLATQTTASADSAVPYNTGGTSLSVNSSASEYQITVGADKTVIDLRWNEFMEKAVLPFGLILFGIVQLEMLLLQ